MDKTKEYVIPLKPIYVTPVRSFKNYYIHSNDKYWKAKEEYLLICGFTLKIIYHTKATNVPYRVIPM